jgi:aspartate/methionine/tyrosine aminotransferase
MTITSKLPAVGLTIFTEMTNLANACGAINLSQGFPEFDPHPDLKELVSKYIRDGHNQYAPMQGVMALRERIAEKVRGLYRAEKTTGSCAFVSQKKSRPSRRRPSGCAGLGSGCSRYADAL